MKLYHTKEGVLIARKDKYYLSGREWVDLINADHIYRDALGQVRTLPPVERGQDLIENALLLPVGRQAVWAAGVTYFISLLRRGFAELVGYLYRESTFPHGCLLMTGTGIVPPDVFTLHHGDVIEIMIDGIGTLRNIVE